MALQVILEKGGTTYSLRADKIVHMFTRLPTQIPLPADNSGNPQVFSLDLGMSIEQITLQGVVDTSGSGTNPSKANLEDVLRTWWDYGDTPTSLAKLTIASGQSYYGHFKSGEFTQEGALEDRWGLSLVFLVRCKI